MKITKRQLRRIIREEKTRLSERGTSNPAMAPSERSLINAVVKFVDDYQMTMGMSPGNPDDIKRIRRAIDDIIESIVNG